jgi:hypothetical protein
MNLSGDNLRDYLKQAVSDDNCPIEFANTLLATFYIDPLLTEYSFSIEYDGTEIITGQVKAISKDEAEAIVSDMLERSEAFVVKSLKFYRVPNMPNVYLDNDPTRGPIEIDNNYTDDFEITVEEF